MMKRYQTLLCLSISLTTLAGCDNYLSNYFDSDNELAFQNSKKTKTARLSTNTEHLALVNMDKINDALHEQQDIYSFVVAACHKSDVPESIALIPFLTTYYNPQYNQEDRVGLWELTPALAQNLSLHNTYWFDARADIVQSTDAVIAYMKFLHNKLDNNWELALIAYKAGVQPVLDAINTNKNQNLPTTADALDIPKEAKQFTKQLAAVAQLLKNHTPSEKNQLLEVNFPGQIDLESLNELTEINTAKLVALNSAFKRQLTDPDGPHRLLVNASDYDSVKVLIKDASKLRNISKTNWIYHKVRSNESLSVIAMQYETSIAEIKRVNHLQSDTIKINQKLLIPEATQPKPVSDVTLNDSPGPKRILHTVQKQETLYHLSKKYHVSVNDITYWNHLASNTLQPNQVVTIWQYKPVDTARFYTVQPNDSLAKIAKSHRVSLQALKEANHIEGSIIHPNDRLIIPVKASAAL